MICKNLCARPDGSIVSCGGIFIGMLVVGKECPKDKDKYKVGPECWMICDQG